MNTADERELPERAADSEGRRKASSPLDQWAKAAFLVRLARMQQAHPEAETPAARRSRGLLRELAFLIEHA